MAGLTGLLCHLWSWPFLLSSLIEETCKLDARLLFLGEATKQALTLDQRSGSALTDGFTFDIGITQNQYNTGNTLMSVGIVILEVSSCAHNLVYRLSND